MYREKNLILKINEIIPSLELLYQGNDSLNLTELREKLSIHEQQNIFDHYTEYSYSSLIFDDYESLTTEYNYNLSSIYDGKFYTGGWRDYDTIVLYNKENYRDRNKMGYEVGVNKDGIVVSKDVLVSLEPDGYILSGHTIGANFIINNIQLYDKIEIKDNKIYVYRDDFTRNTQYWINERNRIANVINDEKGNEVCTTSYSYDKNEYIPPQVRELLNVPSINKKETNIKSEKVNIDGEIITATKMKHPVLSRFRETYSLVRDREAKPIMEAIKIVNRKEQTFKKKFFNKEK